MAQTKTVPVLSEAYLAAVSYLMQYRDEQPALSTMKYQLIRGEDLSDKQVAYVIKCVRKETDYA